LQLIRLLLLAQALAGVLVLVWVRVRVQVRVVNGSTIHFLRACGDHTVVHAPIANVAVQL